MDNRIHDIVLKFSQQVKKLLGQKLDKVILYVRMLVEIIMSIRI